jgi:butyrate kinase
LSLFGGKKMVDIEKVIESELIAIQKNRPAVVFCESKDERIIESACYLTRFIRPIFLEKEEKIRKIVSEKLLHLDKNRVDFAISESVFIDINEEENLIEEFTKSLLQCEKELNCSYEKAKELVREPSRFGIYLVKSGYADMVVGGAGFEPVKFLRPALKVLKDKEIQGEAGVFALPDDFNAGLFPENIVVFGDVGVNEVMTPKILAEVAIETCKVARDIIPESILPEINGAIVSYSNRGSDEGPSPQLVREATKLLPRILEEKIKSDEKYKSIRIEGEVKVSAAISRKSAERYFHKENKIEDLAGKFNVIIAPNLEVGNFLYHLYSSQYPEAKKISALFGCGFKVVDLAIDCNPSDIILSLKANLLRHNIAGNWRETPKDRFFKRFKVLAINPGSTSTKIAYYEGEVEKWVEEIKHNAEELKPFAGKPIVEQGSFRKEVILKTLNEKGVKIEEVDAISARGGLLDPISSGTYEVNEKMLEHLKIAKNGEHASNLGAIISDQLLKGLNIKSFIVDPVVVDELPERVKITGLKEMRRKAISHALNQIASAKRYADENETFYNYLNLIVCHMGGGISVGAHKKGRYIDVNNALDGEGPFSPERSGSLPVADLIKLCFSGKYTKQELLLLNKGRGGMIDHLNTSDLREVEKRIDSGDEVAKEVFDAMAYQVSKEIASRVPAFDGEKIDQIIITGGMARSNKLIEKIKGYICAMGCGITVYPGENEMLALTKGALRVLSGKEKAKIY